MKNQAQTFERRKFYNSDDSGKVFLLTILFQLVISLIISLFMSQIASMQEKPLDELTKNVWYVVIYSIINVAIYFGIYFFYNKYKKIEYSAVKPRFKLKWHTYFMMIAIGAIVLFGTQYFIGAVDNFLSLIGFPLNSSSMIDPKDWGSFILAVIVLALIPAIGEELIFRGVVLNGLRKRFSDVKAVLLTALLFALMHANLQQLVYPFLLGAVMGWVAVRTGSLISSIIIHFTNNFLVVLSAFLSNTTSFSMSLSGIGGWFYLVAISLLIVTAVILYLIDMFYFKKKSSEEIEKEKTTSKFVYIAFTVGVGVLVVMSVMAFATA